MKQYLDLVTKIIEEGTLRENRTGVDTVGIFGHQMRFNMADGFPLLTTKKLHTRSIFHELLWILSGNTNIKYLNDNGVTIWDEWADENGDLGPVYGKAWRNWESWDSQEAITTIDQLKVVHDRIISNPDCRRLIVTAWNPVDLPKQALAPCHCFFQFSTRKVDDGKRLLDMQLYMRSVDVPLGMPFNIASYALLLHMMASSVDMIPGDFLLTSGDTHIYVNQLDGIKEQMTRDPKLLSIISMPKKNLFDYEYEDFTVEGYDPHPSIKMPVAV